ncbi:MAG: PhnA protein [Balneolaceae bacterium]|nr:PhnA protein [Balneolaceae bacterium]
MSIENELRDRSDNKCELCTSEEPLAIYNVPPESKETSSDSILICDRCRTQIEDPEQVEPNHWRCLNESMWSQVPAVQVMAWRMLDRLRGEGWPLELLDMLYLDEETLEWAKSGRPKEEPKEETIRHLDSNGSELENEDTVVLIKDLNVKGANFTAKRGTAVRRISLVHDNAEHIEGRVNGQQIVILTKYVKKSK